VGERSRLRKQRISRSFASVALPLAFGAATSTLAQDFSVERIATGLSRPVFLTAPPADTSRVFIVEQRSGSTGRIQLLPLPSGSATTFLSISPVATGSEQGLLGLAFHPDFATNGYFYVNFTDAAGDTRIVRYHADGDPPVADPTSATMVLSISQPQSNHNGGWMAFGPDRYLYVATGDGGGGNDNGVGHTPEIGNAQDGTDNLLGKILRLDVDGDDFPEDATRRYAIPDDNPFVGEAFDDEIWALGLRNPWRPGFDRTTGDLYIADVGQGAREEIDVEPASDSGGENYGWRLREGTIATPTGGVGGPAPAGAIDPIYDYTHGFGPGQGRSVTGGYVYRGAATSLQGRYFFADHVSDGLWSVRWDGSDPSTFDGTNTTSFTDWTGTQAFTPDQGSLTDISSFGEDAAGNLYIVTLGGDVFRVPEPPTASLQITALGVVAVLAIRTRQQRLRRIGADRRIWTTNSL